MNGSSDVRVDVLTEEAPEELWGRVAGLYNAAFSAPPYEEDPVQLAAIRAWGPDFLTSPGGVLAIATDGETNMLGFGLGRTLLSDAGFQRLLTQCASPHAAGILATAGDVLVVQELAVSSGARRRGVGTACLQALEHAAGRSSTVLAVYEHAEDAKRFYARQGFRSLGAATLRNGTTLRILARASS